MTSTRCRLAGRNAKGASGMAEFGPAMLVLLICIFFPLMDMLTIGVSYGLVMVLNYNQVHEASLLPGSEANAGSGTVMKGIPDQWLNGMGHFVKIVGSPTTLIQYREGEPDSDNVSDVIVKVSTTITCSPFLPIPLWIINVPGLNGNFTFTVASERTMENPDNPKL